MTQADGVGFVASTKVAWARRPVPSRIQPGTFQGTRNQTPPDHGRSPKRASRKDRIQRLQKP